MTHAYIIDAVRTPRGRGSDNAAPWGARPAQLLAQTLQGVQQRQPIDTFP